MFPLKTIDQNRAEASLTCIDAVLDNQHSSYGTLSRSLPAMLQVNGLGSTLAFLCAKAGINNVDTSVHARLYNDLAGWLHQQIRKKVEPQTTAMPDQFLRWLISQDSYIYHLATMEAMEFSIWLRRFAEAEGWTSQGN
jgi:CRISPR-associated protein Cmr5